MGTRVRQWTFLTNHARVLLTIARDPTARLRSIAATCRITERAAQKIVADLEQAGYVSRERVGRRNQYVLHPDGTFRHPAEAGLPVRLLLEIFTSREADAEQPPSR
ncbi:helix-turn-helix domain-containing protein [Streptomyces iakyrus]|uniref:helix-turn-helix transcriptional regulator n=1 Tax=Streptomyces iakyrus TaxID=68219 RepID=UPI000524DA77|nr:helix-turn-helix domain-containing protein [Streptomyces iakyrus]